MKKEKIKTFIGKSYIKAFCLMLVAILCFGLCCCSASQTDLDNADENNNQQTTDLYPDLQPKGFVTAIGEKLYTAAQDGEVIRLLGTNTGGWLLQEEYMCPTYIAGTPEVEGGQYDAEKMLIEKFGEEKTEQFFSAYQSNWWKEQDFENCAKLGMNVLRLPFGWRELYNTDLTLKDNPFKLLDWFVNTAKQYGIYTILDLHGAYGSQNGDHHSGSIVCELYGNEFNESFNANMWKMIAEHYKDEKAVAGYDLLNEPTGISGNTEKLQWDYHDRLYKAIREVDQNHLIIIESCWEPYHMPKPSTYGWQNVSYEYHYYHFDNGDSLMNQVKLVQNKEKDLAKADFGVPVFVGEFTFFNNMESWQYGLGMFEKQGYSWTTWTYKVWTDGANNWGLYRRADRSDHLVTINSSEEDIMSIWSSVGTENFEENTVLTTFMKRYFNDKYPESKE